MQLAAGGLGRTSPNPVVGAVIVNNDKVVGEGLHLQAGEPHAEVFALREAETQARGGTLYVTLEPCCADGRTPACVPQLIEAGIAKVVVGLVDPDPRMQGRGLAQLKEAGIEVQMAEDDLQELCAELNRGFIKRISSGRPYVTMKFASSLDGKIATHTGDSKYITGSEARKWVHRERDDHDAIMVGINTVLNDDPLLTARDPSGRTPTKIIVDSKGRLSSKAKLFSGASTEFGAEPNSHVAFVDAAMPGMLPVPNAECIRQAVRTGMAIEAQINKWSRFDRKNYFYADLPQGYQISQLYHPLVGEGSLTIAADEKAGIPADKVIGIERIHVEQDAGKSIHDMDPNATYVDLNRSGVALIARSVRRVPAGDRLLGADAGERQGDQGLPVPPHVPPSPRQPHDRQGETCCAGNVPGLHVGAPVAARGMAPPRRAGGGGGARPPGRRLPLRHDRPLRAGRTREAFRSHRTNIGFHEHFQRIPELA